MPKTDISTIWLFKLVQHITNHFKKKKKSSEYKLAFGMPQYTRKVHVSQEGNCSWCCPPIKGNFFSTHNGAASFMNE
uniref:Uncharacterized protein n=1 Tax=Anguilla anguilla TaxID=7936 RepID=A0A0E9W912_ANGAN